MTQRARRIYYSLAFVVFIVTAPIILVIAQGYQWAGWRAGFVPTGVLVISSSTRATVTINRKKVETTQKLTERLRPGQYEIGLSRPGHLAWKTLVSIKANTASIIGPVVLFPEVLPMKDESPPTTLLLTDRVRNVSFSVEHIAQSWKISPYWPTGQWTVTVPQLPTAIWLSTKQRLIVVQTEHASYIASQNGEPWRIDRLDQAFWGNFGDIVFFGTRPNEVVRIDALAQTETTINDRTSAGWYDNKLWTTTEASGITSLYRQSETQAPILVKDYAGQWLIEPGPDGALLFRHQQNHQTFAYTKDRQADPVALGVVDSWWWPEHDLRPLWQSGTQLYTLDDAEQPLLLERGPELYQGVYWVVPGHILVSDDGQALTVRSVSPRQGRGIILQQQFSAPSSLLGVDRSRKNLIMKKIGPPASIYTLSWE